jgi:hypothetical protein
MRVFGPSGQIEPDHLDIRPRLARRFFPDNRQYQVQGTDNWSRIAWRMLGDGRFYWIIADYSEVVDAFTDLRVMEKPHYLTQLTVGLTATLQYSQLTLASVKGIRRGMKLRIEELSIVGYTPIDTYVIDVNTTTLVVRTAPFVVPVAGNVTTTTCRVSELRLYRPTLTVPSLQRALMEAQDFGNPLNVMV